MCWRVHRELFRIGNWGAVWVQRDVVGAVVWGLQVRLLPMVWYRMVHSGYAEDLQVLVALLPLPHDVALSPLWDWPRSALTPGRAFMLQQGHLACSYVRADVWVGGPLGNRCRGDAIDRTGAKLRPPES